MARGRLEARRLFRVPVRSRYKDTSVLTKFPLSLGESPYVLCKRCTVIVLKPTRGIAVRLAFNYKASLLKIVGRVSCRESQY